MDAEKEISLRRWMHNVIDVEHYMTPLFTLFGRQPITGSQDSQEFTNYVKTACRQLEQALFVAKQQKAELEHGLGARKLPWERPYWCFGCDAETKNAAEFAHLKFPASSGQPPVSISVCRKCLESLHDDIEDYGVPGK